MRPIEVRVLLRQLRADTIHVRSGLLDGYARLQSRVDAEEVIATARWFGSSFEDERRPNLDRRIRVLEAGGKEPDKLTRGAVEQNLAANDVSIGAEPVLPQHMTNDRDSLLTGCVLVGTKRTADC